MNYSELFDLWKKVEEYRYEFDNLSIDECKDIYNYIPDKLTTVIDGEDIPLLPLYPRDAIKAIYRGKLNYDGTSISFLNTHHPINNRPDYRFKFYLHKLYNPYRVY